MKLRKNLSIMSLSLTLLLGQLAGCQRTARSEETKRNEPAVKEDNLHPGFSITKSELEALIDTNPGAIPEAMREAIMSDPEGFLSLMEGVLKAPEDRYLMADKAHELAPDYEPNDLLGLDGLSVTRKGLLLRKEAAEALTEMSAAAQGEGVNLVVGSAYRSYAYQKVVYERNVREMGKEAADRESAMPGKSQHQLGTAVDFSPISDDFAETKSFAWLEKNAERYGFSLSFPEGYEEITGYRWESWHYRYIGKEAALMVNRYFGGIQHYFIAFIHERGGELRKRMR